MGTQKARRFYGSVTVSDRGQVVIPSGVRKDFDINPGDRLLVIGSPEKGIYLAKASLFMKMLEGTLEAVRQVESIATEEETDAGPANETSP